MKTLMKPLSATFKLIVAAALILVTSMTLAYASVSKKVALVIGNSKYETATPLTNPGHDATDMTLKLKELGFDVTSGTELGNVDFTKKVREFLSKTKGADVALFFYAGHGLQVNGKNYLLPVDASLESEEDLEYEAFAVNNVLKFMERNAKTSLIFLDACRNDPLTTRSLTRGMGTRSAAVGSGLAEIGSGVGTLISFATKPGAVALDGEGRNSPFTTALLKHIGTPDQDISETLRAVRNDVLKSTNQAQVPWDNSSLTRRVVLNENAAPQQVASLEQPAAAGSVAAVAPVVQSAPRAVGSSGLLQVEIAFWGSVERTGTVEGYKTYLTNYPTGSFAELARIEIRKLEAAKMEPAALPVSKPAPQQPAQVASLGSNQITAVQPVRPVQPAPQQQAALQPVRPVVQLSEFERVYGIQKELTRLGCRPGGIDGAAGRNTARALGRYSRAAGRDYTREGYSMNVLTKLKSETAVYCAPPANNNVAAVAPSRKKGVKSRNVNRAKQWQKPRKRVVKKRVRRKQTRRRVTQRRPRQRQRRQRQRNNFATGLAIGIIGGAIIGSRRR